jgi:hypothetical protein
MNALLAVVIELPLTKAVPVAAGASCAREPNTTIRWGDVVEVSPHPRLRRDLSRERER